MVTTRRARLFGWLGLAAAVCAGPATAQPPQPPPTPPQSPPAPAQPAPKEPTPAPTVIVPNSNVDPNSLSTKTVSFEMRDKPWKNVLEWLSNETGLPVITTATPTGTFNFYGNPKKKYTIPEVIDVINEGLLEKKFVLIRKDASFTIVPADLQVDPSIVPQIRVEDLKNRGNTEIVQVFVDLRSLVAEDVAGEVRKMMGPFAEVTAMTKTNQLLLQDSAKSLRRVIDNIERMEKSEKQGQNESYSHECKYVKARDAERILKELLGDPNQLLRQITAAQQPQQGQPNQPRPAAPAAPPIKVRMYYVSVDDRLNTVLVTGPADKIAQAKTILERIDQPQPGQKPVVKGPAELRNYPTATGAAEQVAKWLQDYYKSNSTVRIAAVGGNSVMVYAFPEEHFEIAKLIRGADAKANETTLLPISSRDPDKVATMLKGMFTDAKSGSGPYIEADAANSAVVVRGTAEQVADVKAALAALGESGAAASGNVRVISLDRGSAAALAAELQRLMGQMRTNPVRVVAPGAAPEPKPAESKPPASPGGNGGGQDPPQLNDPRQPKPGTEKPVTFTVVGNRLIITSEDPAALALANELARLLTQTPAGEGDFEIIRLKNANATDAARVIDEAFNGPRGQGGGQQQPQFQPFGFGGPFGGRFGGMQQQQPRPADATAQKVRVVADPTSNSLLVKASPIDMLSIKRLLKDAIDSGSERATSSTHVIGPLKAAKAADVADVVREVYRDSLNSNSPTGGRGGGFFPFGGGQPVQRITDANGNPRPAALTVSTEEGTNTIVVHCSEALFRDIDKLVQQLDNAAAGSPRSIRVVSVKGIDPAQLQAALDALQGGNGTNNGNSGFFSPFGQFGGGNRGGGNRGGGNRGGGNRGGGNRGGGGSFMRFGRAPDREPGGPGFFDGRVTDDPLTAAKDASNQSQLFDPSLNAIAGEEQQSPPPRPDDIRAPRAPVNVEALEQLGVVIINAENEEDLKAVMKVIEYLQQEAAKAVVEIRVHPLKQADATNLVNTLNQVFSRVIISPSGNLALPLSEQQQQRPTRQSNPFFGTFTTQTEGAVSILMLPLPRFNAILIGAPKSRIDDVIKEIDRLDQPNAPSAKAVAFPLKKASASRVAGQVQNFYAARYPNETDQQNQIRITFDDPSNTVFVQAAPADLAEIRELIERIDGSVSSAVNDLQIVPLRNAVAEELSNILVQAVTQGVVAPSAAPTQPRPGAGQQFPGAQQPGRAPAATQTVTGVTNGITTKNTTLRFYARPGPGGAVESGLLEDVHITPEPRSNSLIISAPPRTMELLMALIRELDVISAARAEMKIFTLKKGDAQQTAALLNQLFLGGAAPRTAVPGAAGAAQPAAAAGGATRPLLSLTGQSADGATLVDLRISVDDRTNSLIIAGSRNDLDVIEAVISRLEDSTAQTRRNEVYRLRNAAAADVALALQNFLGNAFAVLQNAGQNTAYQTLLREVVVYPEPISNSILISSSPQYFDEVMRIITQLDELPPQVVIQVLVVDVSLTNTEEFGVEVGLQSPILFQRSIIPGTASFTGQNSNLPLPTGITVNSTLPGAANPGFSFNPSGGLRSPALTPILPQYGFNAPSGPGVVGFQGLGNLGVGRVGSGNVGGLVFSAASDTFSLLIRALKLQGRIDILSRPQVMTLDNQTAAVNVGQNIPIVTSTTITATGLATNNIERRDVGILLRVTPRITPDGRVLMRVFPEVSSRDPVPLDLGNGQLGTVLNIQQVETTVAAYDGETVMIGGLITTNDSKQENKIPVLGDLPWIGAAFRYRTQARSKRELMVILTPHIVRSQADAQRVLAEEARRMDWIIGDVCKLHGPGGLEAILPPPQTPPSEPCTPLPVLNGPLDAGVAVPTLPPPAVMPSAVPAPPQAAPPPPQAQPVPVNPPPYVPGQPVRPGAQVPQPASGSAVLPATYIQAPPPKQQTAPPGKTPAPPPAKESKPWVFRRDW